MKKAFILSLFLTFAGVQQAQAQTQTLDLLNCALEFAIEVIGCLEPTEPPQTEFDISICILESVENLNTCVGSVTVRPGGGGATAPNDGAANPSGRLERR